MGLPNGHHESSLFPVFLSRGASAFRLCDAIPFHCPGAIRPSWPAAMSFRSGNLPIQAMKARTVALSDVTCHDSLVNMCHCTVPIWMHHLCENSLQAKGHARKVALLFRMPHDCACIR